MAHENLIRLLLIYKSSPQEARDEADMSLQKLPSNPNLYLYLGLAEYELGNKKKALEAVKTAYQLNPTQQNLYFLSAIINNMPIKR